MRPLELAIVVQRYGPDVDGGAELHCRWLAERLAARHRVTVLTTTAADYRTWAEAEPAGESIEGGVRIVRFPVTSGRAPDFDAETARLLAGPHSPADEERWLEKQGPVAPALPQAVAAAAGRHDALIVYTYLYWPALAAARAWPGPLALVPTAHDEPVAGLAVFDQLYARADGLLFLTPEEEAFCRRRYPIAGKPARVAGVGIELEPGPPPAELATRYELRDPYLLYLGRIEAGKGCAELTEFHARHCRAGGRVQLVLAGRQHMPLPDDPALRYLGFVPEDHKAGLIAGALAVVAPSPFESLSILALEGFAGGRPVLASARSEVLVGHCRRSGAGLYYAGYDEFAGCLDYLAARPELAAAMGRAGQAYVQRHYRWEQVLAAVESVLAAIQPPPSTRSPA